MYTTSDEPIVSGKPRSSAQFSWALFAWAKPAFFTVVTTYLAPYFANVMVGPMLSRARRVGLHRNSTSGI